MFEKHFWGGINCFRYTDDDNDDDDDDDDVDNNNNDDDDDDESQETEVGKMFRNIFEGGEKNRS